MLIVRRKIDEVVGIGNKIQVKILNFNGNQVQMGIHAPRAVPIFREEVNKMQKK